MLERDRLKGWKRKGKGEDEGVDWCGSLRGEQREGTKWGKGRQNERERGRGKRREGVSRYLFVLPFIT